ncbi:MAG: hypothetical protein H7338_06880, partial [Candidatus Sericytochromatia bacterium]|nr:hypothetical protein [Candidatus Sericytochromatia bacterium]
MGFRPQFGRQIGPAPRKALPAMSLSSGIDVLVIEDDADIRDVIVLVLAETGYRVATAANGLAGLDYLRCRPLP